MSELPPFESTPLDRSDPAYLDRILVEHYAETDSSVFGVRAGPKPPESFAELQEIADRTRKPECSISGEVDAIVEIIGALPDRDDVAKLLPYDPEDGFVMLIIPKQ